jgi:hypothetical protein
LEKTGIFWKKAGNNAIPRIVLNSDFSLLFKKSSCNKKSNKNAKNIILLLSAPSFSGVFPRFLAFQNTYTDAVRQKNTKSRTYRQDMLCLNLQITP